MGVRFTRSCVGLLVAIGLTACNGPPRGEPSSPDDSPLATYVDAPAAGAMVPRPARVRVPSHVLRTPEGRLDLVWGVSEVDLSLPLLAQLPRDVPVIDVEQFRPWLSDTHIDDRKPSPVHPERVDPEVDCYVHVSSEGARLVQRGVGEIFVTEGVDLEPPANAPRVPVRYASLRWVRPFAYGPAELTREHDGRRFITVPTRVVVNTGGNPEVDFEELDLDGRGVADAAPPSVKVFSRLPDGREIGGVFPRNFSRSRVPDLNDWHPTSIEFVRGLGFIVRGAGGGRGYCGLGGFVPENRFAPGQVSMTAIPGSEEVSIDFGLDFKVYQTSTPTFSWGPAANADRYGIYVTDGVRVLWSQRDMPGTARQATVLGGLLRPGRTYRLSIISGNWRGFATRETKFEIAPGAVEAQPVP